MEQIKNKHTNMPTMCFLDAILQKYHQLTTMQFTAYLNQKFSTKDFFGFQRCLLLTAAVFCSSNQSVLVTHGRGHGGEG